MKNILALGGVREKKLFILPMKQLHLGTVLSLRDGIHIKVFYLHIGVCRPPHNLRKIEFNVSDRLKIKHFFRMPKKFSWLSQNLPKAKNKM